ncbi:hypothetical protein E3E22_10910, partial [Thermococcus sp. MV5]|nr:hypothetical protein [Thermococcus sp. MV5]
MIGLVTAVLTGIITGQYAFAAAAVPYILRLHSRNLALIGFYAYALALATTLPGTTIYGKEGLVLAVGTFTTTFLVLDEILRSKNP